MTHDTHMFDVFACFYLELYPMARLTSQIAQLICLFNIAMENHGKSPFLIGKPSINGPSIPNLSITTS